MGQDQSLQEEKEIKQRQIEARERALRRREARQKRIQLEREYQRNYEEIRI